MKVISILDPVNRSTRIYSRCVRLYPKNFRQTFQRELVQVFQAKAQALYQQQKLDGLILFWLHTFIDTLKTVLIEHLEEVFDMKRNTPRLIASAFAALGGLLAIIMVFANWSTLPYPFPSKASLLARLWASVPVESDFAVSSLGAVYKEERDTFWFTLEARWEPELIDDRALFTLTRSELEELKPYVTERELTDLSYFEAPGPHRWYSFLSLRRIFWTDTPWHKHFAYPVSAWQVHASPLVIGLPSLWLAGLIGVAQWKKGTKLGSFGLVLGGIGCAVMIASLYQAVMLSEILAAWPFFTGGMILLGLGLVIFGLDALRSNTLPRGNWLPVIMGFTILALEAGNRLYLPDPQGYQVWAQVQGLALAAVSIAWLALGWFAFTEKQVELLPT